jgi:hypothetical protein
MKKQVKKEVSYCVHMVDGNIIEISEEAFERILTDIQKIKVEWFQIENGTLINANNISVIIKDNN